MRGTYVYQDPALRRSYEEGYRIGYQRGMSKAILLCLEAKGVDLGEEDRKRIQESDAETLDKTLRRAVTATSAAEIFE